MYRYFEYDLEKSQAELDNFYSKSGLEQHSSAQEVKSILKLKRLRRITIFKSTDVVLDYGCGVGYVLHQLKKIVARGVGVDISATAVEKAPKADNLEFKVIKFDEPLVFESKTFDKVLILDVLEHVLEPEAVIADCRRVLKSNGEMLIEVPFSGFLSELLAGKFHEGHLRYYDPFYLRDWLTKQNLVVKSILSFNSVPLSKWWLKAPPVYSVMDMLCNIIPPQYYPWFGVIVSVCELP